MAPENILRAERNGNTKIVRFADNEGHELCEIFHVSCSNACQGKQKSKRTHSRKHCSLKFEPGKITTRQIPSQLPCERYQLRKLDSLQERVDKTFVSLENIVKTEKGIIGIAAVKNIAYSKDVSVAYSFDEWTTAFSVQASFHRQDESRDIDYFFFIVSKRAECLDSNWKLEFAICYKVLQEEFWDNNDGHNYQVKSD